MLPFGRTQQKPRMTVTPPVPGARAPHRRSTRRMLATVLAVMLLSGAAAPAYAATPTPEPSASADGLSGVRQLDAVPDSNGILRPGQPLNIELRLANGLTTTAPAATATVSLGTQSLGDRAALDAWLAGGEVDPGAQDIGAPALPAATAGGEVTAAVSIAPDDPLIAGRGPGVYTLRAVADVGGETLVARSVVVVPSDPVTPVGVVVPITAGPLQTGLLTREQLEDLTAPDGALTAQLAAVEGTPAILAVDPAIPAAIRVLGTSAPASAVSWLARLTAASNTRFALQFGDADVATQMQAGLPAPLEPISLLAYMSPGNFATDPDSTPSAAPSPTATSAPTGPVYPGLTDLTDIGSDARPAVFWPTAGAAGPDVISALGTLGQPDAASRTLVPSTSTTAGAEGRTVPAAGTAAGAGLLVYDAPVSSRLSLAAASDDDTVRDDALVAATAELAFATGDAAGRPLLIALDRDADRDRAGLRASLSAALALAAGSPALSALADAPAEPVQVVDAAADTERTGEVTLLMGGEQQVADFATILDDPQLLTGPQRAEILQLLAVGWSAEPDAARDAFAAHRDATAETLTSVGIVSTNVVLVSYGSEGFRPYVRNDLPYPITLSLVATSDTASLAVNNPPKVRAEADTNTLVSLPIEARIANATAVVSMQLYSPTGVPIGRVESATVEVHAEWETIALVALGTIMVLFLAGGIVRTVLRRRQAKADAETAAPDGADA